MSQFDFRSFGYSYIMKVLVKSCEFTKDVGRVVGPVMTERHSWYKVVSE